MVHEALEVKDIKWGLVVTSDRVYRGEMEDQVTPLVENLLAELGYRLVYRGVAPNNPLHIQLETLKAIAAGSDVVLVTGGTGPRPRDVSVDAVSKLADRELPGIGELFRRVSFEKIGARAYISRATAFIVHGSLVVVTPGNPDAAKTMLLDVLRPLIGHLVHELRRK